jgi:hypothetical protein
MWLSLQSIGHIINNKKDIKITKRRRKGTHKINSPNIKISLRRIFVKGI